MTEGKGKKNRSQTQRETQSKLLHTYQLTLGKVIIIVSGWRRDTNDILFKKQSGNSSRFKIDNVARIKTVVGEVIAR